MDSVLFQLGFFDIFYHFLWELRVPLEACPGPRKQVCQQTNQRSTQKVFVSSPSSKLLLSDYWVWTFKPLASFHGCCDPKAYFSVPWLHQAKGCLWGTHACRHVALDFLLSLWLALSTSLPTLSKIFFLDNLVIAISTLAAASLYTHQTLYTHLPCYYYHSGVLYCYIAALKIHHTRK